MIPAPRTPAEIIPRDARFQHIYALDRLNMRAQNILDKVMDVPEPYHRELSQDANNTVSVIARTKYRLRRQENFLTEQIVTKILANLDRIDETLKKKPWVITSSKHAIVVDKPVMICSHRGPPTGPVKNSMWQYTQIHGTASSSSQASAAPTTRTLSRSRPSGST